jgi:hypothetical protein
MVDGRERAEQPVRHGDLARRIDGGGKGGDEDPRSRESKKSGRKLSTAQAPHPGADHHADQAGGDLHPEDRRQTGDRTARRGRHHDLHRRRPAGLERHVRLRERGVKFALPLEEALQRGIAFGHVGLLDEIARLERDAADPHQRQSRRQRSRGTVRRDRVNPDEVVAAVDRKSEAEPRPVQGNDQRRRCGGKRDKRRENENGEGRQSLDHLHAPSSHGRSLLHL